MVIGFKTIMGASAIGSVLIIAATERGPATSELVLSTQDNFDERYPFVIVTPKQDRDMAVLPPKQEPPQDEAKMVRKVEIGHKTKPPVTCERRYFYVKGHKYWSCRRAR